MAGTNRRAAQPARRRSARVAPGPKRKRRFFDYPRTGYQGLHRWLPSWRFMVGSFLGLCFLGLGALVAAYISIKVPTASEDVQAQTTTVYYANNADGTPGAVMGTFQGPRREIVEFSTLPDYVGNAVVASEDQTFWKNSGVSVTGTARALINNLRGRRTQGGSTLTQQYVERYYVDKTTTDYVGKLNEALLAIKIARTETKQEILGRYLNTIYFGRDSYGIQVAAQSYFGVDAKDLTISEAAMLVGIMPSPNNWDPAVSPTKSQQRWAYVLDNMVKDGRITQAEREAQVFPVAPELKTYVKSNTLKGTTGYILNQVRKELIAANVTTDDKIGRAGLKIVTTVKEPAQKDLEAAVGSLLDGTIAKAVPVPELKVAAVSIDPASGGVVAMYGGPDFVTQEYDRATQDAVQAGSTYKPFTLIAALEKGIGLSTTFNGKSPQQFPGWEKVTKNFDNKSFGDISLVEATAQSVNTVYAQLNIEVGADKTADVATRAGVTTPQTGNLANVLGTDTVHPIDMASAYATIAAQGAYNKPHFVSEASFVKNGVVMYKASPEATRKQAFAPEVMADATYAMTQVVETGSGKTFIKPLGRPIAGKTGTTNDNKSAWFVGFTPQISTAVALFQTGGASGNDQVDISSFGAPNGKTGGQVTGGSWPAALWAAYMKPVFELPEYAQKVEFPPRANLGAAPTSSATPTDEPTVAVETPVAPTEIAVPGGLEGKLEADASAAIVNAGLQANVTSESSSSVAKGYVIRVEPASGTTVAAGGSVTIVVSTGPAVQQSPTPNPTASASVPPK